MNNRAWTTGIASPTKPLRCRKDRLPRLFALRVVSPRSIRREVRARDQLRDLTDRFSYDCLWRAETHGRKGKSGCGVYLPDLDGKPGRNEMKARLFGIIALAMVPTLALAADAGGATKPDNAKAAGT